jgi:hypothetical protein
VALPFKIFHPAPPKKTFAPVLINNAITTKINEWFKMLGDFDFPELIDKGLGNIEDLIKNLFDKIFDFF